MTNDNRPLGYETFTPNENFFILLVQTAAMAWEIREPDPNMPERCLNLVGDAILGANHESFEVATVAELREWAVALVRFHQGTTPRPHWLAEPSAE